MRLQEALAHRREGPINQEEVINEFANRIRERIREVFQQHVGAQGEIEAQYQEFLRGLEDQDLNRNPEIALHALEQLRDGLRDGQGRLREGIEGHQATLERQRELHGSVQSSLEDLAYIEKNTSIWLENFINLGGRATKYFVGGIRYTPQDAQPFGRGNTHQF